MGLRLISKNSDFSTISVGVAGYTSVTTGMLGLHHFRVDGPTSIRNLRPGGGASGTVIGTPTYFTGNISGNNANYVDAGFSPSNVEGTFIAIFKIRPGTITSSFPAGCFNAAPTTKGAVYFNMLTANTSCQAITFPDGDTPPLAGSTTHTCNLTPVGTATWEMYVIDYKNDVGVALRHPRLGTSNSVATTVRDFVFDAPGNYSGPLKTAGTGVVDEVALIAAWSRQLTSTEITTVYTDLKASMAFYGLTI